MDSMVLVTDWNFRSNEDSRAPADEADEEEALLLPPPPPAAIFPVCTSARWSCGGGDGGGSGQNNQCECVRAVGGREARGWGCCTRWALLEAGRLAGHAGGPHTRRGGAAAAQGCH